MLDVIILIVFISFGMFVKLLVSMKGDKKE